ncbi:MAG: 2-oxoacid:acceptor oxidoreductase subunit alpha, partial [Deltaproteobacteria bacterium]
FIQMEDELGSIAAVIGASWAGARSMTATSGPGLSLMMEGIGYGAFTETPFLLIDVQRAGPGTGQATRVASGDIMQVKWGSHGDYQVIALSPWSCQDMYDFTIKGFNLAEKYRVPVFIMAEEAVGHLRERISVKEEVEIFSREKRDRKRPFGTKEIDGVPSMPSFGEGARLLVTGSTHDEMGYRKTDDGDVHQKLVKRINLKILNHKDEITELEAYFMDDAEIAIICYGFTARSALFATQQLRKEGKKVGMVRLKTLWPFPDNKLKKLLAGVKDIFVPEMNMGQVASEVKKATLSKIITYNQTNGEIIHPHVIIKHLKEL